MKLILAFLLLFPLVCSADSGVGVIKSVIVYTIDPDAESAISVDRDELLRKYSKKIDLGYNRVSGFSRKMSFWVKSAKAQVSKDGAIQTPHVVIIMTDDAGLSKEVILDVVHRSIVFEGKFYADGDLFKSVYDYVIQLSGGLD